MRIIAGSAKGRRLVAPDTPATRPATDRVREALFSSIGSLVEGARVLDLYAGSGSYGLEALSRGAASALFVENGRKAVEALRRNLTDLGIGGVVAVAPVSRFLRDANATFDLVFVDPPWDLSSDVLSEEFALLDRLLATDAVVVASRRKMDPAPIHPGNWRVATDRRHGDTRILRYEKQ